MGKRPSLLSAPAAFRVLLLWKASFVQRANGLDFFNKSIDISNPGLVYSPAQDWIVAHNTTSDLTVKTTDKVGATVSFNFTGTQVIVVGAHGVNAGNSSVVGANYTIDGGNPVTSTVDTPSDEEQLIMFASPNLPYKNHTLLLTVVDDVPFYDFLGLNITTSNTPPPSPSSTKSSSHTPTKSPSSQESEKKHGISKGIIGGIVVAVLLLFVLAALCFYLARWRRRQNQMFGGKHAQRSNQFAGASYESAPATSFVIGTPSIIPPPDEPVPPLPRHVLEEQKRFNRSDRDREVHSPTSTIVSEASNPSQGGGIGLSVMRQPSVRSQGHSSNNSQTHLQPQREQSFSRSRPAARHPWPLSADAAPMSTVEDEQSILPEMKPSGGILARSKESLAMMNLNLNLNRKPSHSLTGSSATPKKEKPADAYPDFFQWS